MREDGYFDERIAAIFNPQVVDPVVGSLMDLVGPRRKLEFGIGTGTDCVTSPDGSMQVSTTTSSSLYLGKVRRVCDSYELSQTTSTVPKQLNGIDILHNSLN